MRNMILLICITLSACSDQRCLRDNYFCSGDNNKPSLIHSISDTRLIRIAELDERYSRPPSGEAIYEMRRRGATRAMAIYYRYSSHDPNDNVIDNMTRVFSNSWPVCSKWLSSAPSESKSAIRASCYRVFRAN